MVKKGNRVYIDYKYLIGITASLRQINLSLARSRWTSWNELCLFYTARMDAEYFFMFFIDLCKKLKLPPEYHELKTNRLGYIISRIFPSFFLPKNFLTTKELETLYFFLTEFKKLLRNDSTDSKQMELVRYPLAIFYSSILEPKLKIQDLDKVMKVEHHFQNENLETYSLNEIVGS